MNTTTLGLIVLATGLTGAVLAVFLRWAKAFDWRSYFDRLPRALRATWVQCAAFLLPVALVLIVSILGRRLISPYSTLDDALAILAMLASLAMFVCLGMALETFAKQMSGSPDLLSMVERQRAYDTGRFARPSQINAALQDQDEHELAPEFDE